MKQTADTISENMTQPKLTNYLTMNGTLGEDESSNPSKSSLLQNIKAHYFVHKSLKLHLVYHTNPITHTHLHTLFNNSLPSYSKITAS